MSMSARYAGWLSVRAREVIGAYLKILINICTYRCIFVKYRAKDRMILLTACCTTASGVFIRSEFRITD